MNRKKITLGIEVLVGVIVISLVVGFIFRMVTSGGSQEANLADSSQPAATVSTVPADTVVPNEGDTAPPNVAIPAAVAPAPAGEGSNFRVFAIKIADNAFTPSIIEVNQDDIVNLQLTASDANYSFTQPDYGFNFPIAKGYTQKFQFQATKAGKYTFYCGSCGGPTKGPIGYIIIVPKQ